VNILINNFATFNSDNLNQETMDEIDPTTKMVGAIKLKEFSGDEYSTHKEAWIPWINYVIGCAVDA
jgi:hypothetical protein